MHGGVRSLYFHFPYAISSHHDRSTSPPGNSNINAKASYFLFGLHKQVVRQPTLKSDFFLFLDGLR